MALRAGSTWSGDAVDPLTSLRKKKLDIGILIYPRMDQIDFTGPFAVLSRLPDSAHPDAWSSPCARERWSVEPRGFCAVVAQRRIGPPSTCCATLARLRSIHASSSMAM
jgi:hypothetical protein